MRVWLVWGGEYDMKRVDAVYTDAALAQAKALEISKSEGQWCVEDRTVPQGRLHRWDVECCPANGCECIVDAGSVDEREVTSG